MPKSMLIDITKCNACNACTQACKVANSVPKGVFRTKLSTHELGTFPKTQVAFLKHSCKHCESPACVSVCPAKALSKTSEGPVVFDDSKCIGCRACSGACPFGVPSYAPKEGKALPVINKCDFCTTRVDGGEGPACAQACPFGAIELGERSEMLALANGRIKSRPDAYVNQVYGEKEIGGTNVLYISNVPFADLGLPKLGPEPKAQNSQLPALPMPIGMGFALTGVVGLVQWRKNRMERIGEQETRRES